MRIIGKLPNDTDANRFSAFLKRQGIENHIEIQNDQYDVWVADEDRIQEASAFFERFLVDPMDPFFDEPILDQISSIREEGPPEDEKSNKNFWGPVTCFFLALCVIVFLIDLIQEIPMREEGLSEQTFLLTPIQASFLFDLPPGVEKLEAFIQEHEIPPTQKLQNLSPELRAQIDSLQKIPYWQGAYEWILLKIKNGDTAPSQGPLFHKILDGQIWRLFTPCLLHGNLIHILFNMIWLWVLGRPIELRIGAWPYVLLTLVVGVSSNIVQYLVSGPLFLGYSGIIMGLAGFIWMRERIAPWEGYPLQKGTILFLGFFILAMFVLQMLSFFVQIFSNLPFILSIANTAHVAGAIIGALLARLPYFARR